MATKPKSKNNLKSWKRKLGPHREAIAWVLVLILLLLLLWAWWKPISNFFGDLTGSHKNDKIAKTTAEFLPATGEAATSTTTGSTGSGGTSTNRSTSTNTTTNRSTTTPTTGGPNPGPTTPTPTTPTTTPSSLLFANIAPGQSLNTVIDLAGTQPNGGCLNTQIPLIGTQQVCTFSESGRNVIVTLLNNQVIAKAKAGF